MNMKRLFALIALSVAVLTSIAQGNRFGLVVNGDLTGTTASESQWKLGGNVGTFYDIKLVKSLYLQPRLLIGYEEAEYKKSAKNDAFFSQWNVTLPVLLSYRFALSSSTALRFNVGPYGQYALFGRERQQFTDGRRLGWWHGSFSRRFNYGLQIGAEFECSPRLQLLLDGRLSFKSSALTLDGRQRALALGIGYRL